MSTPEDLDDDPLTALLEDVGITEQWLVGFAAALAVGPDHVAASTWMPDLLEDFEFTDDAEAEYGSALLREYVADVAKTLEDQEGVCPDPDDEDDAADFAEGFLAASRLHEHWAEDETAITLLLPFAVLSGALPDKDIELDPHAPIKDLGAWKKQQREILDEHVAQLGEYFRERRAAVPKTAAKTGRNDPCPCGSGAKYKKCHGAAS
ncbi:MAG: UPF0149 family protein [Polyangiaceae bacterium]